jgi:hypothetical protein
METKIRADMETEEMWVDIKAHTSKTQCFT